MNSNYPLFAGAQYPDSYKPQTGTSTNEGSLLGLLNSKPIVNNDIYGSVPTTSSYLNQWAQKYDFGPTVRIVENITEQLDGWWFVAARPRVMSYNEVVNIIRFPRRAMPILPSDVPAPRIQHEQEEFRTMMDEHKLQFEMEGKYLQFGGAESDLVYQNYLLNIMSSFTISWKMKITNAFMRVRQNQWAKHPRPDNPKTIAEINKFELTTYAQLDMDHKALPSMLTYVSQLSSVQNFSFNMAVLPYGRLDRIAANAYFSEAFRSGENAVNRLFAGGKALAGLVDGIRFFEDAVWNFKASRTIEEENFVHIFTRGGFIYNNAYSECDDDDDPNCRYGIEFVVKGSKNWARKTLLDLIRESGRYTSTGEQDSHINVLCEGWADIGRVCGVNILNGRLDPQAVRVGNEYATNDKVLTRYVPATKFGEVDVCYSTMARVRTHIRRMKCYVDKELTQYDLAAISKLETFVAATRDVGPLTEAHEAFFEAVAIQNSSDIFTYRNNNSFKMNVDGAGLRLNRESFLERDPFNMAPKRIPEIRDIPPEIDSHFIPFGQRKCLVVQVDGEDCAMFTIRLDDKPPVHLASGYTIGYSRGQKGDLFAYVAIPLSADFIAEEIWNAPLVRDAPKTGPTNIWNYMSDFDNIVASPDGSLGTSVLDRVGNVTSGDTANTWPVTPELYEKSNYRFSRDLLKWTFRPTVDVGAAFANADNSRLGSLNNYYWNGSTGVPRKNVPGQGFKMSLSPVPTLPFGYNRISTLRYLADLYRSSEKLGWDENMLKDVYEGVTALVKLFEVLLGVYTPRNMYFNPAYVPLDIHTKDTKLDRINSAISALWCEGDMPFLVRRPIKTKSSAGNMIAFRSFLSWDAATGRSSGLYNSINLFEDRFKIFDDPTGGTRDLAVRASEDFNSGGVRDVDKRNLGKAVVYNTLLDSGLLPGRVKDVVLDVNKWNQFKSAYEAGTASYTYRDYLNNHKVSVSRAYTNAEKKELKTILDQEFKVYMDNASNIFGTYLTRFGTSGTTELGSAEIENIAAEIYNGGYLLSSLITLFLDSPDMDYSLGKTWLDLRHAQASDPIFMNKTSEGSNPKDLLVNEIKKSVEDLREATRIGVGSIVDPNVSQYWVNTGLCVSPKTWFRFKTDLDSAIHRATTTEGRLALYTKYCTPVRPMQGLDYFKPVAGDPIKEFEFLDMDLDRSAAHMKTVSNDMSQAMSKKGNEGIDREDPNEPLFNTSQRMKTRRDDVDEIARGISNAVFEPTSKRRLPREFLHSTTFGEGREGKDEYMDTIRIQTDGGAVFEAHKEPTHMKLRLNTIEDEYKTNKLDRIFGYLWCFSPFHMDVIENFINKKIAPAGLGYIWMRPCQRDRVGAVLFTVGNDTSVAEAGYNYTAADKAYNQQHNKVNVVFTGHLGCTIYQPDKVLWLDRQTFHGNLSGMGSEAYVAKGSYNINNIHNQDKDGFVIYVGDNLRREDLPDCISITSKYNVQRYSQLVSNRAVLDTDHQHVPGLLYTISKYRLDRLNEMNYNQRNSYFEEKNYAHTNTDCYEEDHRLWNKKSGAFSDVVVGKWHLSGLTPLCKEFLDGQSTMNIGRVPFSGLAF